MTSTHAEIPMNSADCAPTLHYTRQEAAPSVKRGFILYMDRLLSKLIHSHASKNGVEDNQTPAGSLANFFCQNIPRVSFEFFLERFVRLGNIDEQTMV